MAAAAQGANLKDEATCSICLEYFTDPVTIDCGHNFCRSCITQRWEGRDENFPCPQCREISPWRSLRPNRQLGNIVEMLKQLHLPPVKPPEEHLCEKHEERLRLFCEEDQRMICVVCRESKDHKSHTVSPIEEAAEEYKVKLHVWLCSLKREMGSAVESKHKKEEQCAALKNKLVAEKKKISSEIEELQQLLREKEETLQGRLNEMHKKITLVETANITKLSNQIMSLKTLIMEIEKKCEEPAWELLKDVSGTLSRCNKVTLQNPEQKKKTTKKQKKKKKLPRFQGPDEEIKKYKVMVTLDPDTAHCELILSEDYRHTLLNPHNELKKLGVYLDYEGGWLSLYNADYMELLFTFPQASFQHRLFPIFYVYDGVMLRMV
ncbi:hypothetical protein NDU88_004593 [Pleurodeles waltl]|uniref:RING-type E3 ubiquitin transferase n=1 Tax=Pleurodeles waltl TaxID=8319 RepID=A0AAV7V3G3_PLEWA|nr:hypothetical protein NDU88_004593 [Pleurodeles waltl]